MPNIDNPNGFRVYTNPNSSSGTPTITPMLLADGNAAIGINDPLTITGGRVDRAAAGNALCGTAAEAKDASSGTAQEILVYADPDQQFVAQTDNGTGTGTAIGAIGLNFDFVAGVPSNGRSIAELDEDSALSTATLPFKSILLSNELQGNAFNAHGEFVRLIVKINNHQLLAHTGTAGS